MFRWGGLKGSGRTSRHPLKQANERCPPPLVGLFDKLLFMKISAQGFELSTFDRRALELFQDEASFGLAETIDLLKIAYRVVKDMSARGVSPEDPYMQRAYSIGKCAASIMDSQTPN